jgi:hypothetical protein
VLWYEKANRTDLTRRGIMANGQGGGGNGGVYAILIIIVILILAAVLYMSGAFGGGEDATDINADVNIENPVGDGGGGGGGNE